MLNQFENLSCYEEFEIQSALAGISKVDVLKNIGHQIDNYYFFVSNDGIFNWFDLDGNHVEDPNILKELKEGYIPISITNCIIPDSVISIGNEVYSCCNSLTSITIPNNVTSIGRGVFVGCKSLISINIPNGVSNIGNAAFYGCESLKSISIPDSVTSIGNNAFVGCESLKSISIPDSVTSIGNNIFWFCDALKEVIFKGKTLDDVKQMKNYPFGIGDENVFKCS